MMTELTPSQIAELNELGEAEVQASFIDCAPEKFTRPTRADVKRIGSVVVTLIPALDSPFFNRILGLGVGRPATEAVLDEAIGVFQAAGCDNYMAQVSPLAQPDQLPEWLAARGLKPSRNWAKMYRGNDPAPVIHTDLRLELVGKDQADAFGDLVITTFEVPAMLQPIMKCTVGQPGWYSYLAYDGEKPVACTSMHIRGDVAWLGNMGTLEKFRKRGAQGALFARCIRDGLALGVKWFITETGEDTPEDPNPSYHNMLRNGFQLAYLRRNYVHQVPAGPVKLIRRALFVAAYTLKFGWQRLWKL
jgi:hypothetical protein